MHIAYTAPGLLATPRQLEGMGLVAEPEDISRADFTWCMTAISWGHGIEATAERLMEESAKARENGERYAWMTAGNAAAAVQRRERSRA